MTDSDAEADAEMAQGDADAKALAELMAERGFGPEDGYDVLFDYCLGSQDLRRDGEWFVSFDIDNYILDPIPLGRIHLDCVMAFSDVCREYYSRRQT